MHKVYLLKKGFKSILVTPQYSVFKYTFGVVNIYNENK